MASKKLGEGWVLLASCLALTIPCACTASGAKLAVEPGCTVGKITANKPINDFRPGGYCVDKVYYRGAPVRIGRSNLFGARFGANLAGKLVVLSTKRHSDLAKRLTRVGPCSDEQPFPIQFRGDWMADEGGYNNQLAKLAEASYLEALTQPTALNMLEVKQPDEAAKSGRKSGSRPVSIGQVKIAVRNPFDQPLSGLDLIIHYEGGPGKPMPFYETRKLNLKPGQRLELQFPTAIEREIKRGDQRSAWWKFSSATLAGQAGGCTFLPSTYRR